MGNERTLHRIIFHVKRILIGFIFVTSCFLLGDILEMRVRINGILQKDKTTTIQPVIKYERCQKWPKAPNGTLWPEELYLHDTEVRSVLDLADPKYSRVLLESSTTVKVGDTIKVNVKLYDGLGRKRNVGGDLIRVYMREESKKAASRGHVIDHRDGSYTAILTAFWEGQPEIIATIISPREVIAVAMKRRYTYPPVLMNTAIFQHPVDNAVTEETPCNYDNQVPGYTELCNFTEENYGRPWYCGKPRHLRLLCQDWTMAADRNLWNEGYEEKHLSNVSYEIMKLKYTARKIQANMSITVQKGLDNRSVEIPETICNPKDFATTWYLSVPTGFLYGNKWYSKYCRTNVNLFQIASCLKNTHVILIGDSTLRQIFEKIETYIPCTWITDKWSGSGKHRPTICINSAVNFSLTWKLHSLPFCTRNTPRHYFKSFSAYMNELQHDGNIVLVLHVFAHFLNHHSHVFFETLKNMKSGIVGLLERNPNVRVIIKGPHAYSFSKSEDHAMWMPDVYADVYQNYIYEEFKDLSDRIIYLECMDMTISSEQWHIHVEDYVVEAVLEQIFSHQC